jgi:hypothetical protein
MENTTMTEKIMLAEKQKKNYAPKPASKENLQPIILDLGKRPAFLPK